MGGAIAIVSCSMFPDRYVKGVFLDAAAYPFKAPLKGRLAKVPVLGGIIFKHLYGWGMFQEYFRTDVFHEPSRVDMGMLREYYRAFDRPDRRAYMHRILPSVTEGAEVAPHVPRVKQPCLVIWGSHDSLVPLAVGQRLAKELPDNRFEIIDGSGHAPQEEVPEKTVQVMLDFLA
jgi:pimeloyl-ACP methyl ester carboxylesterase